MRSGFTESSAERISLPQEVEQSLPERDWAAGSGSIEKDPPLRVGFGALAVLIVSVVTVVSTGLWGALGLGGVVALALTLKAIGDWRARYRLQAKDLLETSEAGTYAVQMTIYQDGIVTGRNIGALWSEDGCLLFSGRRSSFVLGREAIATVPLDEGCHDLRTGVTHHEALLRLAYPRRKIWLRFELLDGHSWWSGREEMDDALKRLLANVRPDTGRRSELPPLRVDPTLRPPSPWP